MADRKNVLVFPAGTEIAFEILDALKTSKFVRLYGATGSACHADFVFETCFEGIPYANDPACIPALNDIIDQYKIDYIYPAHDSALLTLCQYRDDLHCPVVAAETKTIEICRDKNKTYEFLAGSPYLPVTFSCADEVKSYPVFVKPAVGQGSEGARKIFDRAHLDEVLSEGVEYSICEYLPGDEFTVDCFTDIHGALRFVNPRTRDRIRAGIAVRSHTLDVDDRITAIAEDINSKLSFNGAWFFQVKRNNEGEYRLMEVAPRIAGTMGLTRNLGVNMPLLTMYNMWGYDVDITSNNNYVLLDRAFISRFRTDTSYSSVFVDFDDTIIIDGKVNAYLMMFLYQAKNVGKKLVLLSRHATDIYVDLDKYNISRNLFDEIIVLSREEKKTDYITPGSIFIDDSFAERKAVKDSCSVPVFDLDMVESLIDWRA